MNFLADMEYHRKPLLIQFTQKINRLSPNAGQVDFRISSALKSSKSTIYTILLVDLYH